MLRRMGTPADPDDAAAAVIAAATAPGPVPARELAVFDLLDALPRPEPLEAVLAALWSRPDLPPLVRDLLPYARPQAHAPLIIGHRGDPTTQVENTLDGIRSAFRQGADAVELDVLLVRRDEGDGWEPILRHDPDAGGLSISGLYAWIRNLGLEPRVYADDLFLARPTTPPMWRQALRRPSHDLPLSVYRTHYGYAEVRAWPMSRRRLQAAIPTLDQAAEVVADGFHDRWLFLDTKLPPDRPDLWRAMAAGIRDAAGRHGLEPARIIVGNSDAAVLGGLRDALGRGFRYSLDAMLIGPFARASPEASASARAIAFDTDLGDVGHVFWGSDAELLALVEYDVPEMHRLGKQLIVWTVNGEAMFRRLLGVGGRHGAGGVDMVITDRPTAFRARLDRLGLPRRPDGVPPLAVPASMDG